MEEKRRLGRRSKQLLDDIREGEDIGIWNKRQ